MIFMDIIVSKVVYICCFNCIYIYRLVENKEFLRTRFSKSFKKSRFFPRDIPIIIFECFLSVEFLKLLGSSTTTRSGNEQFRSCQQTGLMITGKP